MLSNVSGLELTPDLTAMGDALMDGRAVTLLVYNPLASARTEMVTMQVPICNMLVATADGTPVLSQVTAQFTINDGLPPFYDFDLHFEASTAPLSYTTFVVTPSIGSCGGGDTTQGAAAFLRHQPTWPVEATVSTGSSFDRMVDARISEQRQMAGGADHSPEGQQQGTGRRGAGGAEAKERVAAPSTAVMENAFLKVYIELSSGIQAVLDKGSGKNYSLRHELMEYQSVVNDACAHRSIRTTKQRGWRGHCARCLT